jgi:phosphoserine phosphatase
MSGPQITLLITLTGRDRPGVTSRLFSVLAAYELSVIDIEQVVIRGRLVLGVLLSCDDAPDLTAIHRRVGAVAADLGLDAEITTGSGERPRPRGSLHVTVLGTPLAPAAIAAIAGRIAASGANIDRIGRLAHRPVTCIEFEVSGADPDALRGALARLAEDNDGPGILPHDAEDGRNTHSDQDRQAHRGHENKRRFSLRPLVGAARRHADLA